MQDGVKKLYGKIQKLLISLVPENWRSIYLYASVINGKNGEMYFYYYPKKIIKTNPVNCYEVPNKYGIDDESYNKGLKKLYSYIKQLNSFSFPRWSNITIIIKDNTFTAELRYNNIVNSPYSDEQRRLLWSYKYLQIPLESLSLGDRILIETYKDECEIKPTIYTEPLYISKGRHLVDSKGHYETKENEQIEKTSVKNQILKY